MTRYAAARARTPAAVALGATRATPAAPAQRWPAFLFAQPMRPSTGKTASPEAQRRMACASAARPTALRARPDLWYRRLWPAFLSA